MERTNQSPVSPLLAVLASLPLDAPYILQGAAEADVVGVERCIAVCLEELSSKLGDLIDAGMQKIIVSHDKVRDAKMLISQTHRKSLVGCPAG